jgi:N,N'-diacetyllegionaminate synthase
MKTFIIAEAGINHNGNMNDAFKLCRIAKTAGCNAIKFQTYISEKVQSTNDARRYQLIKKCELSFSQFTDIKSYCDTIGIEFMSTGFDIESITFLNGIVKRFKISSGCNTNTEILELISDYEKPVIMSCGMSTKEEIKKAYEILNKNIYKDYISLLYCRSIYPVEMKDINLLNMLGLKKICDNVGYSDHSTDVFIPSIAVAMGAKIIEKHFTIDKNAVGPDHALSLNEAELRKMVELIRNAELVLTDSEDEIHGEEIKIRELWNK